MNNETASRVNRLCEHNWSNCLADSTINKEKLASIVRGKMYGENVNTHVDEWLGRFEERSGSVPLISKAHIGKSGGGRRIAENEGHISILN